MFTSEASAQMVILEKLTSTFAEFGLAGLVILCLFALLAFVIKSGRAREDKLMSEHRGERKEWRQEFLTSTERSQQLQDQTNRAIEQNTAVVSTLKDAVIQANLRHH